MRFAYSKNGVMCSLSYVCCSSLCLYTNMKSVACGQKIIILDVLVAMCLVRVDSLFGLTMGNVAFAI